MINFKLN